MRQPNAMRILVVADVIPMRDRSAGWLRFYHLLRMLADRHEVHLHPVSLSAQLGRHDKDEVLQYGRELKELGIRITSGTWEEASRFIRTQPSDIVFFEQYSTALRILDYVRFWQPGARIIVDTIDIAYHRLLSKAKLTADKRDLELARAVMKEELDVYSRADVVISISDAERMLLAQQDPEMIVDVIPLVYDLAPLAPRLRDNHPALVYVAHFEHDANVDGIVYFCGNVLPLIQAQIPDVRIKVVGHAPPEEVRNLAGSNVEVLGYVADIRAVYETSDVAIAPMRFGGGLKGKIAEAMSFGVPVVTNSTCLSGFGLTPGINVLIGDDAQAFAEAVVRVLSDGAFYESLRQNAWQFINSQFSTETVGQKFRELIERAYPHPPRRLALRKRISWGARLFAEKHLLWRIRSGGIESTRQ